MLAQAHGWRAPLLLCLIMLAGALPLIFGGHNHGRGAYDQNVFHLIAIRDFAHQWPHFNFADYSSATTPGYHIVLAAVDRFVSDNVRVLQLFGTIFSIGLIATLATAVARYVGTAGGMLLCLPCVCSLYVLYSCVWLLPDNAGWWGVVAMLLVIFRPKVDAQFYTLGGITLLLLVLVRQGHLWIVAPFFVAAWIGDEQDSSARGDTSRWRRIIAALIAIVPALGIVIAFAALWHGMTPPSQRPIVSGFNAAGPAMALAVTGALGVFFVPLITVGSAPPTEIHRSVRDADPPLPRVSWVIIGALLGGIIAALPVTTYSLDQGRYSGIWNAVKHCGYVHDRSILLIALAMLGGAVIGLWLSVMQRRQRRIWAVVVLSFGATQLVTRNAFQRYDEPMILIAAALSVGRISRHAPKWAWCGPALLAVILAGIMAMSLR